VVTTVPLLPCRRSIATIPAPLAGLERVVHGPQQIPATPPGSRSTAEMLLKSLLLRGPAVLLSQEATAAVVAVLLILAKICGA